MINRLIVCFTLIFTMSSKAQTASTALPKEFFACWKSAHEENNEKKHIEVYRPCSYAKFKPSRFRLEIEFFESGKCKFLRIGPTDNHYFVDGKWSYDEKTKLITVVDDKDQPAYKFKISSAKKELLKVVTLTQ